jgi:hypothetical protein
MPASVPAARSSRGDGGPDVALGIAPQDQPRIGRHPGDFQSEGDVFTVSADLRNRAGLAIESFTSRHNARGIASFRPPVLPIESLVIAAILQSPT